MSKIKISGAGVEILKKEIYKNNSFSNLISDNYYQIKDEIDRNIKKFDDEISIKDKQIAEIRNIEITTSADFLYTYETPREKHNYQIKILQNVLDTLGKYNTYSSIDGGICNSIQNKINRKIIYVSHVPYLILEDELKELSMQLNKIVLVNNNSNYWYNYLLSIQNNAYQDNYFAYGTFSTKDTVEIINYLKKYNIEAYCLPENMKNEFSRVNVDFNNNKFLYRILVKEPIYIFYCVIVYVSVICMTMMLFLNDIRIEFRLISLFSMICFSFSPFGVRKKMRNELKKNSHIILYPIVSKIIVDKAKTYTQNICDNKYIIDEIDKKMKILKEKANDLELKQELVIPYIRNKYQFINEKYLNYSTINKIIQKMNIGLSYSDAIHMVDQDRLNEELIKQQKEQSRIILEEERKRTEINAENLRVNAKLAEEAARANEYNAKRVENEKKYQEEQNKMLKKQLENQKKSLEQQQVNIENQEYIKNKLNGY